MTSKIFVFASFRMYVKPRMRLIGLLIHGTTRREGSSLGKQPGGVILGPVNVVETAPSLTSENSRCGLVSVWI
jgi:hypothetical protein